MSAADIAYLIVVIVAFVAFAAALGGVDRWTSKV